jgi:uncharacterized phage protein (TIGR01671 family)
METIFEIKLKAINSFDGYQDGQTLIIVNSIFDKNNGVAFLPINKNFEIIYQRQFTGQVDASGRRVFAGDIAKIGGSHEVVEYIDGILCSYAKKIYGNCDKISIDDRHDHRVYSSDYFKGYEIVGNIYENPELL